MFGDRAVTLLTHRLGGRSWLRQRLAAASGSLAAEGRGPLSLADYADRRPLGATVLVVRNPLSMLLEASALPEASLPAEASPSRETSAEPRPGRPRATPAAPPAANLVHLWRTLTAGGSGREAELRLPDFADLAAEEPPLVVRVEDFVAFPAVTLRRIGEYVDRPPSRELLHAFLRADRPTRHRAQPAIPPASRTFDLFSWVDDVPPAVAAEVYAGCRRFVDDWYPELAAVLREVDAPAHRRAA